VQQKEVKLEEMKEEELPEEMRGLSVTGRKALLVQKSTERKAIQEKMDALRVKRAAFIAEEQNKAAQSGEVNTLDKAMSKALRSQTARLNYTF